eukprot:GILK01007807.1.p1 GENE.GILK01007807.1~~GILK01007807.1.p1  ORF type:complete len:511 (-),score=63.15 GILK01007807.1:130-1662(-)
MKGLVVCCVSVVLCAAVCVSATPRFSPHSMCNTPCGASHFDHHKLPTELERNHCASCERIPDTETATDEENHGLFASVYKLFCSSTSGLCCRTYECRPHVQRWSQLWLDLQAAGVGLASLMSPHKKDQTHHTPTNTLSPATTTTSITTIAEPEKDLMVRSTRLYVGIAMRLSLLAYRGSTSYTADELECPEKNFIYADSILEDSTNTKAVIAVTDPTGPEPTVFIAFRGTLPWSFSNVKTDIDCSECQMSLDTVWIRNTIAGAAAAVAGGLGVRTVIDRSTVTVDLSADSDRRPLVVTDEPDTESTLESTGATGVTGSVGVHCGFYEAYKAIAAKLLHRISTLLKDTRYQIVFTGHSLGGALASIAALDLLAQIPNYKNRLKVVTFGAPGMGKPSFVDLSTALGLIERTVNIALTHDWVPSLTQLTEICKYYQVGYIDSIKCTATIPNPLTCHLQYGYHDAMTYNGFNKPTRSICRKNKIQSALQTLIRQTFSSSSSSEVDLPSLDDLDD